MKPPGLPLRFLQWITILTIILSIPVNCNDHYTKYYSSSKDSIPVIDVTKMFEKVDPELGIVSMKLISSKPIHFLISMCDDVVFETVVPIIEETFVFQSEWKKTLSKCRERNKNIRISIVTLDDTNGLVIVSTGKWQHHHTAGSGSGQVFISQDPHTSKDYRTELGNRDDLLVLGLKYALTSNISVPFNIRFAKCNIKAFGEVKHGTQQGAKVTSTDIKTWQLLKDVICSDDSSTTFQTVITTQDSKVDGYLQYSLIPSVWLVFPAAMVTFLVLALFFANARCRKPPYRYSAISTLPY